MYIVGGRNTNEGVKNWKIVFITVFMNVSNAISANGTALRRRDNLVSSARNYCQIYK